MHGHAWAASLAADLFALMSRGHACSVGYGACDRRTEVEAFGGSERPRSLLWIVLARADAGRAGTRAGRSTSPSVCRRTRAVTKVFVERKGAPAWKGRTCSGRPYGGVGATNRPRLPHPPPNRASRFAQTSTDMPEPSEISTRRVRDCASHNASSTPAR